jgi:putative endonuclease
MAGHGLGKQGVPSRGVLCRGISMACKIKFSFLEPLKSFILGSFAVRRLRTVTIRDIVGWRGRPMTNLTSRNRSYFVYILSSTSGVLYTGLTNDLVRRIEDHQAGLGSKFTTHYRIRRLIYWETYNDVEEARRRERQIKSWRRDKKLALIRSVNPKFEDLSENLLP